MNAIETQNRRARILAVTSGKGGVGKTHFAVNLAIALAELNRRVVLWDLDLGLANVDVVLHLRPKYTLGDVIEGRATLPEIVLEGPGGIQVMPGASGDEEVANLAEHTRDTLARAVEYAARDTDYVIIDTGAGLSNNVTAFTRIADDVLVIATPEPTAMVDGYGMLKVLSRQEHGSRLHFIVNMARSAKEARAAMVKMASIADGFMGRHLEEEGYIPFDEAVADSVRRREPLLLAHPHSKAAIAVRQIALAVLRVAPGPIDEPPAEGGFVERLLRRFGGT